MTPRTLNRLKLVGIGVLAALPVIASYVLYWFWTPEQHTNYGTLLEARALPEIPLRTLDGDSFAFTQLRGHWTLLMIDGGHCGPRCQEKLWLVRQVRQAQGKNMNRVERVWLIDDEQAPAAETLQSYPGVWIARGATQAIGAAFPAEKTPREHIYLVDPFGNLILRYPREPEPKRIIQDLTRLLKYSRSG